MRVVIIVPIQNRDYNESLDHFTRLAQVQSKDDVIIKSVFNMESLRDWTNPKLAYIYMQIKFMNSADAILLGKGWNHCKNCRLMKTIATQANLRILYENS